MHNNPSSPMAAAESDPSEADRRQRQTQRERLSGVGERLLDLVFSETTTCRRTAEFLRLPLERAAKRGEVSLVQKLIAAGADSSDALNQVVRADNARGTMALLSAGADASLRGGGCYELSMVDAAAFQGSARALRAILDHGVDVNAVGPQNAFTALHHAAAGNSVAAIKMLLEAGADIEASCRVSDPSSAPDYITLVDGSTPLLTAAKYGWKRACLALLTNGANVKRTSASGRTVLHYAAMKGGRVGTADVIDLLLKWDADENAVDGVGLRAIDVVGSRVKIEDRLEAEVQRVRELLASAREGRMKRRLQLVHIGRLHGLAAKDIFKNIVSFL